MRPVSEMPQKQTILVYAQWYWDGIVEGSPAEFSWRVARYVPDWPGKIYAETSNPYIDIGVNPLGWAELPDGPMD